MEEPKKGAGVDGIECQHFSGDGYSAIAETLGVVERTERQALGKTAKTYQRFLKKNIYIYGISTSGIHLFFVLPSVRKTKHILNMYSRHQKTIFFTLWPTRFGRKLDG